MESIVSYHQGRSAEIAGISAVHRMRPPSRHDPVVELEGRERAKGEEESRRSQKMHTWNNRKENCAIGAPSRVLATWKCVPREQTGAPNPTRKLGYSWTRAPGTVELAQGRHQLFTARVDKQVYEFLGSWTVRKPHPPSLSLSLLAWRRMRDTVFS